MSIDTRLTGLQSLSRNQGSCGSCWAVVVAYAVENRLLQSNIKARIAESQIMQDSKNNFGCKGGDFGVAIREFLDQKTPIPSMPEMTYAELFSSVFTVSKLKFSSDDEKLIMQHIDAGNAVAGAMSVKSATFLNRIFLSSFAGDVLGGGCSAALDHQVLFAGYGRFKGRDVWVLKNTWGSHWGNYGYFYVERGQNTLCSEQYYSVAVAKLEQKSRISEVDSSYFGYVKQGSSGLDKLDGSFKKWRRTGSLNPMEGFLLIFLVAFITGTILGVCMRLKKKKQRE
ncbi:Cathepsin L [Spironucleus salmonicida]|uniref:Cathepsin L n=1 Tax=Spironucleus salmonicida TaxID=348837 RepID=V6LJU1_9EUKA|nr:Cathepsin L [Spironucleus salmonicida]|eukprot:EST44797.1 Cathepsin L [Spironucleus salmonicida]